LLGLERTNHPLAESLSDRTRSLESTNAQHNTDQLGITPQPEELNGLKTLTPKRQPKPLQGQDIDPSRNTWQHLIEVYKEAAPHQQF
jgi:hypothetical protein